MQCSLDTQQIRLNYDNGFHNTLDYNHSIYRDR